MQRDEKAAAAETAGTEGALVGGGGILGQLEPTWARRERGPDKLKLLEEKRKGQRGPQDHEDGTVSLHRWEQEAVGGNGKGGSGVKRECSQCQEWKPWGMGCTEMGEAEEAGWRLMEQ